MTADRSLSHEYDAIVVGARCAGSPTAMLLARRGYRVLLVDRASFPSDTISSHAIRMPGVALLHRWGLLDAVAGSNCPPVRTVTFDLGDFPLRGTVPPHPDGLAMYAPRRTVLDTVLVEAAARDGGSSASTEPATCRTSFADRTDRAGPWSEMPVSARIPSRPGESAMPSATPSSWRTRSMPA